MAAAGSAAIAGTVWSRGGVARAQAEGSAPVPADSPLLNPNSPEMNRDAPAWFKVRFETSKGDIVVQVHRRWAPLGSGRFYNLARHGYFDGCRFFRVINGFMAQFGIHGDPNVSRAWREQMIKDDPVTQSNTRGRITYAKSARPHSRTTQLFINTRDNQRLDADGFAPFGEVIEGMSVVDQLYSEYGEGAPRGSGPDQQRLQQEGNTYLERSFPKLDHIIKATIIEQG